MHTVFRNQLGIAVCLLALCTLSWSSALYAQTITLDLATAVERALNVDPRIAEKEQLVGVARGQVVEAEGAESWIIDLNSFVALAPDVKGGFFEDEDGNLQIPEDALDFSGVSPWYNLQFGFIYPFHTLGKSENYADAAANNILVKQGDVKIQRGASYIDVVRAYNGSLAARETRALLEDAAKKVDSALQLVQGWLDEGEGKAKQSDLFALQTGSGIIRRYLAEAQGFESVAMAGLRFLTGVRDGDEIELADKRIVPDPLPEESLQALQAAALKNRPEMDQVVAGLNARRALLVAKHAEVYPNFYTGIVGSFAISPQRPRLDNISIYDPFNHAGATPILGLKWDWWTGRQQGRILQAEAEYNALVEKKSLAQQGIPFEVAEQFHMVHAHHQMVQQLYEAARAGRRWMIASFADFEAGIEESSKVVTAFQGYILAYSDYVKIVNDYNVHIARLKVVTGEIQ